MAWRLVVWIENSQKARWARGVDVAVDNGEVVAQGSLANLARHFYLVLSASQDQRDVLDMMRLTCRDALNCRPEIGLARGWPSVLVFLQLLVVSYTIITIPNSSPQNHC